MGPCDAQGDAVAGPRSLHAKVKPRADRLTTFGKWGPGVSAEIERRNGTRDGQISLVKSCFDLVSVHNSRLSYRFFKLSEVLLFAQAQTSPQPTDRRVRDIIAACYVNERLACSVPT